ncbi:J domain-containing protein [Sphingomicrobium clamense]|uniref:J domain-containing protein n=1 Tax=Sphingomicrobium clamense TaxID=2851013 RepID=A0ABS6V6Q9_9SPHN|nr:J domain-containing protein [Sphingomicrobium sp. B8]MBW0145249.1 J domain-containing protein [Sphingomicrobium sp. B8]
MAAPDHYAALGLDPDASKRDIRRAYRRLMREHHPDTHPGDGGARAREINAAHDILSDPLRRRDYDRLRAAATPDPAPAPVQPTRPVREAVLVDPVNTDPMAGDYRPGKEQPLSVLWLILLFVVMLAVLFEGLVRISL